MYLFVEGAGRCTECGWDDDWREERLSQVQIARNFRDSHLMGTRIR